MQIGLVYSQFQDLKTEIEYCKNNNLNFITVPLFSSTISDPENFKDIKNSISWSGSDLILKSNEWASFINLKLSSWKFEKNCTNLELCEKMEVMRKELDYACHLGVHLITIEIDEKTQDACAAQILAEFFVQGKIKSYVIVNAVGNYNCAQSYSEFINAMISKFESICLRCDNPVNLTFGFEMSSFDLSDFVLQRINAIKWLYVFLHGNNFHINKKGIPILSKSNKYIILKLLKYKNSKIFLHVDDKEKIQCYLNYFKHLVNKFDQSNIAKNPYEGYEDVPQIPLQPLAKNLESYIYEIFEEDPYKYAEYENALTSYFNDYLAKGLLKFKILLVGAGRGPIVNCILRAAEFCQVNARIVALEKNENAIPTLVNKFCEYSNVEVVHSDIREWNAFDFKADVIISELLGSFGDNELSPECLEAAKRFAHENTVYIPSSYTSYICPVSAPELYAEISYIKSINHPEPYESPYVAHLHTSSLLSSPQICFTFDHSNTNNSYSETGNRYQNLKFKLGTPGVIHGFAGYFSCLLYKDIVLSINPLYPTPGMFSWLPFFFPLKNPINVEAGTIVNLSIWRRACYSYVWYEWSLDHPYTSKIHNSRGKYYKINLH